MAKYIADIPAQYVVKDGFVYIPFNIAGADHLIESDIKVEPYDESKVYSYRQGVEDMFMAAKLISNKEIGIRVIFGFRSPFEIYKNFSPMEIIGKLHSFLPNRGHNGED